MLGGVHVEHELHQRAVEPRAVPLEHDEARAADLRGTLEVENVEPRADLDVIVRIEVKRWLVAPNTHLDVVVFGETIRRVRMRKVRQVQQDRFELGFDLALAPLALLDLISEGAELLALGAKLLGLLVGNLCHRLAGLVALLPPGLDTRDDAATLLSQRPEPVEQLRIGKAAARQSRLHIRQVFAHVAQVEHGSGSTTRGHGAPVAHFLARGAKTPKLKP